MYLSSYALVILRTSELESFTSGEFKSRLYRKQSILSFYVYCAGNLPPVWLHSLEIIWSDTISVRDHVDFFVQLLQKFKSE